MLYIHMYIQLRCAKVSEENQGALGMGARGQGKLTESSVPLNDL